jgi:hypothetical protein
MDIAIENEIQNCVACQATGRVHPPTVNQPTEVPNQVWDTLNMDYLGPLPNG